MRLRKGDDVVVEIWRRLDPRVRWALVALGLRRDLGQLTGRTLLAVRDAVRRSDLASLSAAVGRVVH